MFEHSPEIFDVLIFVAVSLAASITTLLLKRDLFHPGVFFPSLYCYITISPLVYALWFDFPYHVGLKYMVLSETIRMCAAGVFGFFIGALLARPQQKHLSLGSNQRGMLTSKNPVDLYATKLVRSVAIITTSLFLVLFAYYVFDVIASQPVGGTNSKSGAFQYVSETTLRMLRLSNIISTLMLTLFIISDSIVTKNPINLTSVILGGSFATLSTLSGERDFVLVFLIWFACNFRKLSWKVIISAAVSLVLVLGAIPIIRKGGLGVSSIASSASEVEFSEIARSLMHLAPNLVVATNVVYLVPGSEDYWYGKSLLYAAESFLPFSTETSEITPSRWFKTVYDRQGQAGLAFSQEAEAYLNFGFPGVVLWFAAMGYFMAHLYRKAARPGADFASIFIWWNAVGAMMFAIRSDSRAPLKLIVFGSIGVYLIYYVSILLNKKYSQSSAVRTGTVPARRAMTNPRHHLR